MRIAAISAVAGAGSLPAGAALAAGAVGLDWWGNSLRLALSLTLVFASAGIGFWLARLRVARHTEALDAALEALPQPRQMVDRQGRVSLPTRHAGSCWATARRHFRTSSLSSFRS